MIPRPGTLSLLLLLAGCSAETGAPQVSAAEAAPEIALPDLPPAPESKAPPPLPIDVAEVLEPIRARHDLPGLAAALVDASGPRATGAVGVRARGATAPLSVRDRMHLGSCTKSMTATLCALLVKDGRLDWTSTVGEAFADLGDKLHPGWKGVTLEQLLAHRGGAPADVEPKLWSRLFASKAAPRMQREELARGVLASAPVAPPGTKFVYSNAGTALAGLMAELATGEEFETLLRARLFAPLGMDSAGFGPPGSADVLDEPRGHRAGGDAIAPGPGADNPPAIAPAGRVHCSIGDWARYAALHLRGPAEGGLGLSPEAFVRLHAPLGGAASEYALGWGVVDRPWGGRVLTHAGSNTMWYCVAWLAPEKGLGVLIATNQGGDAAAQACDEAASKLIPLFQALRIVEERKR